MAWGDTLEQAVSGLFGAGRRERARQPGEPTAPVTPEPVGTAAAQLAAALKEIQAAYTAGQQA